METRHLFPVLLVVLAAGSTSGQVCESAVDIVFVMDASGSVGSDNFQKTLDFVRDLVDSFNVSSAGVRVGLEKFSSSSRIFAEFHLNTHYDKEAMKTAITNVSYTGGGTSTGDALRFCRTTMFLPSNGDRCHVPNIMVLVTDGLSNDRTSTLQEAQLCRDQGIEIIVLGVGSGVDVSELNAVASDPDSEHVFLVAGFEELQNVKISILRKACVPVQPSRPSHNCTGLGYIPETGGITCMCTTDNLGSPAGRLVWTLGHTTNTTTTLATAEVGATELVLPSDVLKRDLDRRQIECWVSSADVQVNGTDSQINGTDSQVNGTDSQVNGTDSQVNGTDSMSVMLPLNIAYGPDSVKLQVLRQYDASYNLSIIFTCHVTGLNPVTPDMVQWAGPCQGQQGFTCTLDPRHTDVKGKNVTCHVTNSANNGHSAEAEKMVEMLKPSKPGHNCTGLTYIPESGGVTCVCTADDMGYPAGRLAWMMGNTQIATGADNVNQLSLPSSYMRRNRDRVQFACQLSWVEPQNHVLSMNVAYGPDSVELQVLHRYDASYNLSIIFTCHVTGLNPVTPDMVQWAGPCQGQQGFTCTLDPRHTDVKGENVTCRVTNSANNGHSAEAEKMVEMVKPGKPSHNCTDLTYIPETGGVTCLCSTDDLGYPAGRLVWLAGNTTLVTGTHNDTHLPLPPRVLRREYDRTQLTCRVDWVMPDDVLLPLNIAYGPDSVHVQIYQQSDANNTLWSVFHCQVTGSNPLTPDMVQWAGPCQGQQGFTCTLNPRVTKVKGVNVTCRVTNPANNGHSAQAVTRIEEEASAAPQQLMWSGIAGGSVAALAVLLLALTLLIVILRRRHRTSDADSQKGKDGNKRAPRDLQSYQPTQLSGQTLWYPDPYLGAR